MVNVYKNLMVFICRTYVESKEIIKSQKMHNKHYLLVIRFETSFAIELNFLTVQGLNIEIVFSSYIFITSSNLDIIIILISRFYSAFYFIQSKYLEVVLFVYICLYADNAGQTQ